MVQGSGEGDFRPIRTTQSSLSTGRELFWSLLNSFCTRLRLVISVKTHSKLKTKGEFTPASFASNQTKRITGAVSLELLKAIVLWSDPVLKIIRLSGRNRHPATPLV